MLLDIMTSTTAKMLRRLDLDTVDWANVIRFDDRIKDGFICLSWNTVGINREVE